MSAKIVPATDGDVRRLTAWLANDDGMHLTRKEFQSLIARIEVGQDRADKAEAARARAEDRADVWRRIAAIRMKRNTQRHQQIVALREAVAEFLAAEDEVEAEARAAENGDHSWSSAPTVRRIYAVKALRALAQTEGPS